MSNRATDNDPGSMELLLDTVCNTFGGIVFIAMLLSVLCMFSGAFLNISLVDNKPEKDLVAEERDRLSRESESAKNVEAQQSSILKGIFKEPDIQLMARMLSLEEDAGNMDLDFEKQRIALAEDMTKIERTEKDCPDLAEQIQQKEDELARLREAIKEKADADISKDIKDKEEELARLQKECDKARERCMRTADLPRLHATKKVPLQVVLIGGKAYMVKNLNADGEIAGYDNHDVSTLDEGVQTRVTPKAGAGQEVKQGCETAGKIAALIHAMKGKDYFIDFAVYPDSFAQFLLLRRVLAQKGIDYQWTPFENGAPVYLVPASDFQVQ